MYLVMLCIVLLMMKSSQQQQQQQQSHQFSLLTDHRVKELIVYHGNPNSIPKLDKKRFTGKLLKDDFVVELIDILREKYQNDYQKVANILETDYLSAKKSGFGL